MVTVSSCIRECQIFWIMPDSCSLKQPGWGNPPWHGTWFRIRKVIVFLYTLRDESKQDFFFWCDVLLKFSLVTRGKMAISLLFIMNPI